MNLDDPVVLMIRKEMRKRKLNGDQMADGIGINRSTFYKRMEQPETMKLYELRALAKFLKLDIGVLARGIRCQIDHF